MLDAIAMAMLLDRCAPQHLREPLSALVRQASGFEPLVIVLHQNGKPISVRAPSKEDAIAFAAESRVVGQWVKVGLAGLDTRDLERLGLSLGDAFEPCANLRAAAHFLDGKPAAHPVHEGGPARPPAAAAVPRPGPATFGRGNADDGGGASTAAPSGPWDVYGRDRSRAALIYAPRPR